MRNGFELGELAGKIRETYRELSSKGAHRENLAQDDLVTEVDREVTEVVRNHFDRLEASFRISSEELNKQDVDGKTTEPDYTIILDEIDATHHLQEERGQFGPILAVAKKEDPDFSDVEAAFYYNLQRNVLYEARAGEGSYRVDRDTGERERIQTSGQEELEEGKGTGILLDQGMLTETSEIAGEAWRYWCNDYGSQGEHYAMVAEGERDVFITGGKGNIKAKNTAEEAAGMYLILEEAGGRLTDWTGSPKEEDRIGMEEGKSHDVIAAATEKLAERTAEDMILEEGR